MSLWIAAQTLERMGANYRNRTDDLRVTNALLYRLS